MSKNSKKNKTTKILLILAVLCIALLAVLCASHFFGKPEGQPEETTGEILDVMETAVPAEPPVEETRSCAMIETTYLTVLFPEEYMDSLTHREVVEGEVAMEIFSMTTVDTNLELFRIYFGDAQTGNALGILNVDGKEIPVTLSVCEYSEDIFADEQTRELYYDMMDSLNTVLESIESDSRFINKDEAVVEKTDNQLTYWNISLPENMEWEESEAEGQYLITFYGNVNGEKIKLYAVALGDNTLKNVLGTYLVEGVPKMVSVESYELPIVDGWAENRVTELYKMMETINDVIQVIMSSENFSAELPEG